MNDNTILRIKVPAHLYESVKKQLTLTEAKKGGKTYGDWTVVKEKKAPKDGMKKVEEEKVEENVSEAVDPNLIGGIIGILFGSLPLLYTIIKNYRSATTPEEKKNVLANAAKEISKKMGGNIEEAKEEKVEEAKEEEKKEEDK
jgi:hypothetical protein